MADKTGVAKRREEIRQQHWPNDELWTGERELGWFSSPRSLPLILGLLSMKQISGNRNPAMVYLELLSRQRGEGVIEMNHEADHAFAAGYVGNRAIRTWQERMKLLQELGFIQTVAKWVTNVIVMWPFCTQPMSWKDYGWIKRSLTIGGMHTRPTNVRRRSEHFNSANRGNSAHRKLSPSRPNLLSRKERSGSQHK